MIVSQLKRAIQQAFQIDFLANDLIRRGRLTFFNKIATAEFFRTQPDGLGDFVHVTFQSEDALRRPKASKRAVRRNVRRDRGALDAHVRTEVRPGRVNRAARKHHRRQRAVSAAINNEFDVHRQQLSVFRDRGLMTRARWMPLGRRDHVFGTVVDHLHRLAGLPRQQRRMPGNHRRIFFLAAEAAAGLSLNHANFFFG